MKPIFIIEHLEPRVWRWCVIEYENISKNVGKSNVWFTNLPYGSKPLENYGKVIKQSVRELDLSRVCVLDPEASQTLESSDKDNFDYFVFGGILGDYPPKKRTKKELTKFLPQAATRNIGKKQLSTDNAVYVAHEILSGKKFTDIPFQNKITVTINDVESIDLPYYYPLINGKPRISPKLITYLKKKKGF